MYVRKYIQKKIKNKDSVKGLRKKGLPSVLQTELVCPFVEYDVICPALESIGIKGVESIRIPRFPLDLLDDAERLAVIIDLTIPVGDLILAVDLRSLAGGRKEHRSCKGLFLCETAIDKTAPLGTGRCTDGESDCLPRHVHPFVTATTL